jgi:hypothetical protein
MQRTPKEIAEIERHKYLLSEKQGYDVGWEFAEHDWDANYADAWRQQAGCCGGNQSTVALRANGTTESAGGCCQSTVGEKVAESRDAVAVHDVAASGTSSLENSCSENSAVTAPVNGAATNGSAASGTDKAATCSKKVVRYDNGSRAANGPLGRLFSKLFGK